MAETRQERQERIALSNAERKAREQEIIKGLPTLGWMAGLGLPGAGITDTLGLYPEDMSGSGEMLPSFGQNIADKNYLDALYQGLGLFGDAAYASIPVTGPMGVLAGTTLKGASIAGKASRVSKAQKLINQGKASAGTEGATKKMVAETKIPEGKVVDVRKNLNSSFDDPEIGNFKAQTIHDVKTLKDGSVSGSESSIGSGKAISYDPAVTLKSNGTPIELKVNQVARDQIASKTKPKFPMAAVRGIHDDIDIFEPDLVLGFNPMRHNVFVDEFGYGVKSIKNGKTTIIDNDVMVKLDNPDAFRVVEDVNGEQIKLYDDIEYYSVDDLPATNNPSEAKGIAALPESEDYITAYHGSGADFDKFDIRKIGSGEGMQAFGRGLYFAEEELVGKEYQKALGTIIKYDGKTIMKGDRQVGTTGNQDLDDMLMMEFGDIDKAIENAKFERNALVETDNMPATNDPYQWWQDIIDDLEHMKEQGLLEVENTGKIYKSKLNVTPDELLDLDKPLNKQSKVVQEKIDELLTKPLSEFELMWGDIDAGRSASETLESNYLELVREEFPEELSSAISRGYHGDELRTMLEELLGRKGASEALESVGIKGNKYKDEFSRGKEGGTSNFVIFDDRVIDISKKYGITIPMAGAMLMAEDYKNTVEAEEFNQGGEAFDPEGDGYDYITAEKYDLKPDESGHYPSRVPETGQLLKGKNHPTFHLTEREESRLGNIIFKGKDGFYYSLSENVNERLGFAGGGEVENDVSAYLRFYQYAKDAGLQFPEAVAAQASLESGHGKSDLAIYQNNVLGIKPDDSSQASESYDTLEYINGEPVVINDLFRTFDSQEDSFAGYKDKIDKPRYEDAKSSGTPEDYLMAIDEAGYATDPDYAEKVIGIMNRYNSYLEN